MTTEEAHELTLRFVSDLAKGGIKVIIKPYGETKQETIDKYSGPERIRHEKWIMVNFVEISKEDRQLIHDESMKLSRLGISFDTGGTVDSHDWQLDWSFRYTGVADEAHAASLIKNHELLIALQDGTLEL